MSIVPQAGETIDGDAVLYVRPGDAVAIISDGVSQWHYLTNYSPDRAKWRGIQAHSTEYYRGDMVLDDGYLCVCVVDSTYDEAAPIPIGQRYWQLPESPTWVTGQVTASQLTIGNEVLSTKDHFFISAVRAWIPAVGTLEYSIIANNKTDPNNVSSSTTGWFMPTETGWTIIPVPRQILLESSNFEFELIARNTANQATWVANYNYTRPQNAGTPTTGQCQHPTKELGALRFHKTDNDGTDRTSELLAIDQGSKIDTPTFSWEVSDDIIDQGTWVEVPVTPATGDSAGVKAITITTFGTQPIDYAYLTDHWLPDPNIQGFYDSPTMSRVITQDAYGVDIELQELQQSDDWQVIAGF